MSIIAHALVGHVPYTFVATVASSSLFLRFNRTGIIPPQGFALAVPSVWIALPQDMHKVTLIAFKSFLNRHLLNEHTWLSPWSPHPQMLRSHSTYLFSIWSLLSSANILFISLLTMSVIYCLSLFFRDRQFRLHKNRNPFLVHYCISRARNSIWHIVGAQQMFAEWTNEYMSLRNKT